MGATVLKGFAWNNMIIFLLKTHSSHFKKDVWNLNGFVKDKLIIF